MSYIKHYLVGREADRDCLIDDICELHRIIGDDVVLYDAVQPLLIELMALLCYRDLHPCTGEELNEAVRQYLGPDIMHRIDGERMRRLDA